MIAPIIGPVIGGIITESMSWRWVFWVNAPFGVVAFSVIVATMPKAEPRSTRPVIDYAGAVLLALGLTPHLPKPLLDAVRAIRAEGIAVPVLLMGYCNPLFSYGTERFVADAKAADTVVPRGGEALKDFLLEKSRIPVLAAAGGICHVYLDADDQVAPGDRVLIRDEGGHLWLGDVGARSTAGRAGHKYVLRIRPAR